VRADDRWEWGMNKFGESSEGRLEPFPRCQLWRTVLVIDSSEVVVAGPWNIRTRIEFSRTACGTLLVRSRDAVVAIGI
jgi:hypothetical protein